MFKRLNFFLFITSCIHHLRHNLPPFSFWTFILAVALVIAYLAALTRFYTGDGFSNIMLILYANLCILLALHHAMAHLATRRQAGITALLLH